MDKKPARMQPRKSITGEEEKKIPVRSSMPRNPVKKNKPVVDTRKVSSVSLDAPNALVVDKPKSSRDKELINTALNKHFIFTSLADENRGLLIDHMKHYTLGPLEVVFEQDQPGNTFFIVASGKLEVYVNGKKVKTLGAGDSFGELALLHDSPRSATIQTAERTTLWGLDRKTFRHAVETVNAQNYQENKQFIESVPLFRILTPVQRDALVGSLSTLKFRPQERIVSEGDPGDLFYVIKEGSVSCTQEGREIRQMFRGDFFGEQALLYNCVRTASITAIDDIKCVAIGRERLTKALGNQLQHIIYQNTKRMAIDASTTLSRLTKDQTDRVINVLKVITYTNGQVVVRQGTPKGRHLWMVMKGSLTYRNGNECAGVFQCIGDQDITNSPSGDYNEDILAHGEAIVAECTREEFEECIGGVFSQVTTNNEAHSVLKRVQLLRGLSSDRFQALIRALQIREYSNQEVIVQQNNPGDCFFIIKTGKVDVIKDGINVRTITKHDYFGERSVLFNHFRSATIVANGPVSCWVLHQQDFLNIIDENIRQHLQKRIELQDDNITLQDLAIVKVLGKGMFGNVFLAVHKEKGHLYALKTVDRQKIERYEIQENLVLERKILLQLDHTLILKLVRTFKDPRRVYFLTEFVRGMDLFDVLRQLNLVTDKDAKFYTSSLVAILEHLHERDIIYRDLKPENVMIDDEGYTKLIDFGTAKIVSGRTYTIVGTPHYMAPEVIVGKGYSVAVDYWSVGIMLYEFMCGGVPFGEEEEDPFAIYEKVLERRLIYPAFVDPRMPSKPIIEQLLSKNPAMRTGGSIENLKAHPWFNGFNWDQLLSRQLEPPYRPRVSDLSREVQASLKNKRSISDIISIEEASEDIPQTKSRKPKSVFNNWDEEF
ncbi:unnamed protein product [Blepharisma stoltei]|uniref:cGMP-dependent protein kinase n=1 Tax=Blepharisma stoltei TaxID=1481888 RepID=A0AAU9K3I9_9CILI|nr:unnamed protein product [Blepharisma stoltei]